VRRRRRRRRYRQTLQMPSRTSWGNSAHSTQLGLQRALVRVHGGFLCV
jgi:hypothetical protein